MAKWIEFVEVEDTGKTKIFEVWSIEGDVFLGFVRWFGRWRKYAFFPNQQTVFEQDCLRDISIFLDELMSARGKERGEKK